MTRYVARFMKHVMGENGREAEICQRFIELDAPDKSRAAELAKAKFCEAENVSEWGLHADRVTVAEADFPS